MKTIDIIIPIYFAPDLTIRCVESVINTTKNLNYDIKYILVDDSESNELHQVLTEIFSKKNILSEVILIKREKNGGFIEACYDGIQYRESDYKLLLNSDTLVVGDWLSELVKTAESDKKIALVNPITNNTSVINVEMPEGFNIHLMHEYFKNCSFSNTDYIDVVTIVGFCLLIKSEYIKEYGFFDRIFEKGYGEESDLHFRYTNNGLRAVISPKSFIYHRGEASFSDRDNRILKNRKIFLARHKETYEKSFVEFDKKTILHEMRRDINRPRIQHYDVIIAARSNDFLEPSSYFAHKLSNILNEVGVSTVVVLEKKHVRTNQIEDKLYNSIKFQDLYTKEFSAKIIITEPELLAESIRLQNLSKSLPEIKLLESYKNSSVLSDNIMSILKSLNIQTISSINGKSQNCLPFAGSLENIGSLIKRKARSPIQSKKSAIIISDNYKDFESPTFKELFSNELTYIYTGDEVIINKKYQNSFNLSDTDLLKMFSSNNYMVELRKNIYFSEIHLNFILSGGCVVSENILLPSNLPDYIKERIILTSEVSSSKVDWDINQLLELSDRPLVQDYKLNLNQSNNFDIEYYRKMIGIFFKLEKQHYSQNIMYKILTVGLESTPNRIRYRFIDYVMNILNKIPYFYSFLKLFIKGIKKAKRKLKR